MRLAVLTGQEKGQGRAMRSGVAADGEVGDGHDAAVHPTHGRPGEGDEGAGVVERVGSWTLLPATRKCRAPRSRDSCARCPSPPPAGDIRRRLVLPERGEHAVVVVRIEVLALPGLPEPAPPSMTKSSFAPRPQ